MARELLFTCSVQVCNVMGPNSYRWKLKSFPKSIQKIIPAAGLGDLTEAAGTQDPVVAPAGTVLRVWLNKIKLNQHSNLGPAGPENRNSADHLRYC